MRDVLAGWSSWAVPRNRLLRPQETSEPQVSHPCASFIRPPQTGHSASPESVRSSQASRITSSSETPPGSNRRGAERAAAGGSVTRSGRSRVAIAATSDLSEDSDHLAEQLHGLAADRLVGIIRGLESHPVRLLIEALDRRLVLDHRDHDLPIVDDL